MPKPLPEPQTNQQLSMADLVSADIIENPLEEIEVAQKRFKPIILEGEAACRFLGVPYRPRRGIQKGLLQAGDVSLIYEKHRQFINRLKEKGVDHNKILFSNITLHVFNKGCIGHHYEHFTNKQILDGVNPETEAIKYGGEYFPGNTIETFLNEHPRSQEPSRYIVFLDSVKITKELEHLYHG
jgi:hypothetical protein